MQKILLSALLLILVIGGGVYWYMSQHTAGGEGGVVCTMEAKLCPDGSYVGRTGPNCEFAACPGATSTPVATTILKAGIGKTVHTETLSITPLEVLEDSRCPTDVVCIQAGTVRLKTQIVSGMGTSTMTLTLGTPATTEAETIVLTEASPSKLSTHEIGKSEYQFTFTISPR